MTKKASLISFGFILLLIAYDTLQQKYYVETFLELDFSLIELFKRHAVSWIAWIGIGFPLGFITQRLIAANSELPNVNAGFKLFGLVTLHLSLSLVLFTVIRLVDSGFAMIQFRELFIFHMFQKTLVFFMADCTVIILFYSQAKQVIIQSQYVEIKHLKNKDLSPLEDLGLSSEIPQMVIRTGNKIDRILLSEIIWIQSDDYCSKIHTKNDRSFSMRQSLKSLELSLMPYGFVRIHRSVLLNLSSVNQLNLDKSVVKLKNDLELPVSKSRVRTLRDRLSQFSV